MKSLIRSLNERGLSRFRSWLEAGASGEAPFDLLDDPQTSEPVMGTGEVEQIQFANRYDLAVQDLTGIRRILALDRYLFNPSSRRSSKHLIREAVIAVRTHGASAKVLLISPRGGIKDNKVLSELSNRQELIGNKAVIELASLLYFDQKRGGVRRGVSAHHSPGTVQRFALVLQQLSLNFDLSDMKPRQIAGLLPEEFKQWKQRAKFGIEPDQSAGP